MGKKLKRLLSRRRQAILDIAHAHGAHKVRTFGSVARGDEGLHSDIDVLVDLAPGRSLLDLGSLLMDLRDLLGCDVDVVTEKDLHWYIRERVVKEAVAL